MSGTLKKNIFFGYFSGVNIFLSVRLAPCLHLRIEKYITIKETLRAVPCEVLAGDSSTGACVLGPNGANLTKMLTSMLLDVLA